MTRTAQDRCSLDRRGQSTRVDSARPPRSGRPGRDRRGQSSLRGPGACIDSAPG